MPNPWNSRGKNGENGGDTSPPDPVVAQDASPVEGANPPQGDPSIQNGGDNPPAQGAENQQGGDVTPPQNSGATPTPPVNDSTNPPQGVTPTEGTKGTPPPPAPSGEKKRIKCAALKGGKINVGDGKVVDVDQDGFFEVDAKQAARLLSIPGYEEA